MCPLGGTDLLSPFCRSRFARFWATYPFSNLTLQQHSKLSMDLSENESQLSQDNKCDSQQLPLPRRSHFVSSSSDDCQTTNNQNSLENISLESNDDNLILPNNIDNNTPQCAVDTRGRKPAILSTKSSSSSGGSAHGEQASTDRTVGGYSSPELFSRPGLDNQEILSTICDICLRCGTYKNRVTNVTKHQLEELRSVVVLDRKTKEIVQPYDVVYRSRNPLLSSSLTILLRHCGYCALHFSRLHQENIRLKAHEEAGKGNCRRIQKKIDTLTRKINNRRYGTERNASKPKCFLSGLSSTPCNANGKTLFRPTMLLSRSQDVVDAWKGIFSRESGVSGATVDEVVSSCRDIRFCSSHRTKLKSTIAKADQQAKRCSLCCESQSRGHGVTPFPWERLRRSAENICLIEDALFDIGRRNIQPQQIKQLCDACRRALLRDINVRENVPRGHVLVRDYGRTPISIMRLISFVRNQISMPSTVVVRWKEVVEKYYALVVECNEMNNAYRSGMGILDHIEPSLAQSGIHYRTGAKKYGSFFCALSKFDELSKPVPKETTFALSPGDIRAALESFQCYLQSQSSSIMNGNWNLGNFVRKIPKQLWQFNVLCIPSESLLRRGRANSRLQGASPEDEWPLDPAECPDDLLCLPASHFSYILERYFDIERKVFSRSNHTVRGPVITTLSLVAVPHSTSSFLALLNRMACAVSYTKVMEWKRDAILEREVTGPFATLTSNAFVSVQVDNINMRASHALSVHGASYWGFDGLAVQALNSNPSFNMTKYLMNTSWEERRPRYHQFISREAYINHCFPCTTNDPDIEGYRFLAVGMAISNQTRLATTVRKDQQSFRNVLMSALKGKSGGRAKVEYVSIKQCDANNIFELEKIVKMVEEQYNPPESLENTIVALVGDQPIFKMLFRIWLDAYLKRSRRAMWLVPIPGHFHIDKQGIIGMVKNYISGAGLEQLLRFSGLSEKHQDNFISLPHYRKNRRFLSQMTCALILRLYKAIVEHLPDVDREIDQLLLNLSEYTSFKEGEKERLRGDENFSNRIRSALPPGCQLLIADHVHPSVLQIGKIVVQSTRTIAKDSPNLEFFAVCQLFNTLIPWTAFNILLRKGQTHIADKFYECFLGVLHGTNKLNYQENLLYYSVVKEFMPPVARFVLYDAGHLVANFNENATNTNLALDEAMEMGVIRETKMWNTNNPKTLEKSPPFTTLISRAVQASLRQLQGNVMYDPLGTDADVMASFKPHSQISTQSNRKVRDKEKRTAVNVHGMLELLNQCGYYSSEHIHSPGLCNPLCQPPLVVTDRKFITQLLEAEENGRRAASLHIGTKLYKLFPNCALSEDDRKKYFNEKPWSQVLDHWNRRWMFQNLRMKDPNSSEQKVLAQREKDAARRLIASMKKRKDRISIVKASLADVMAQCIAAGKSHHKRQIDAMSMNAELGNQASLISPKAFSYRSNIISDVPHHTSDKFLFCLQELLRLEDHEMFILNKSTLPKQMRATTLHIDVTESVLHEPSTRMLNRSIGDTSEEKALLFIAPFVNSLQYSSVCDLHIHVDVLSSAPNSFNSARHSKRSYFKTNAEEQANDESVEVFDMNSTYSTSWRKLVMNPVNARFLHSLHAIQCALHAVKLRISETRFKIDEEHADRKRRLEERNMSKDASVSAETSKYQDESMLIESAQACNAPASQMPESIPSPFCVFIHGVSIALLRRDNVMESHINDIMISRYGNHILLSTKNREGQSDIDTSASVGCTGRNENQGTGAASTEEFQFGVDIYDSGCCWRLDSNGFERYPGGDCKHSLSVSRIPFELENVTTSRMPGYYSDSSKSSVESLTSLYSQSESLEVLNNPLNNEGAYTERNIVVVRGTQCEIPIAILLSKAAMNLHVVCLYEECLIDLTKLKKVLKKQAINIRDLAMVLCLSGTDHQPHTKGIPQGIYVKALLELRKRGLIQDGSLYTPSMRDEVNRDSLLRKSWIDCEKLVATAFFIGNEGQAKIDRIAIQKLKSTLQLNNLDTGCTSDSVSFSVGAGKHATTTAINWGKEVRELLYNSCLENPSAYLPESQDLELQIRRAVFWLQIWECSRNYQVMDFVDAGNSCSATSARFRNTTDNSFIENFERYGYEKDGAILFERASERERREKLLKLALVRTCKCKAKIPCQSRSCGCRVRNVSCIFCDCGSLCKNQGIEQVSDDVASSKETTQVPASVSNNPPVESKNHDRADIRANAGQSQKSDTYAIQSIVTVQQSHPVLEGNAIHPSVDELNSFEGGIFEESSSSSEDGGGSGSDENEQ